MPHRTSSKSQHFTQETIDAGRQATSAKRNSPVCTYRLTIRADGEQEWNPSLNTRRSLEQPAPSEIYVYLADANADPYAPPSDQPCLSLALLDEAVEKWGRDKLALNVVSFNGAITRLNALDKLDHIVEHSPEWSVTVITDGLDLTGMPMIDRMLRSKIHEVKIYPTTADGLQLNTRVLNAARDMIELRAKRKQERPVVTCLADESNENNAEFTGYVRQVGFDRVEITSHNPLV